MWWNKSTGFCVEIKWKTPLFLFSPHSDGGYGGGGYQAPPPSYQAPAPSYGGGGYQAPAPSYGGGGYQAPAPSYGGGGGGYGGGGGGYSGGGGGGYSGGGESCCCCKIPTQNYVLCVLYVQNTK